MFLHCGELNLRARNSSEVLIVEKMEGVKYQNCQQFL